MTDIIERAEAAIDQVWAAGNRLIFTELVAELITARAEVEQWRAHWRQNTETASAAIRERDEALAELALLIEADDD